jgi:hypothetical protein
MATPKSLGLHSLQSIRTGSSRSLADRFDALVEIEGAGSWPPRLDRPQASSSRSAIGSFSTASGSADITTSSCSWWSSYHILALALASSGRFVDSEDGLHPRRCDAELRVRIEENRSWMARELERVVVVDIVMQRLEDSLADQHSLESSSSRLGFLACLTYLAHLYRWGILPVVSVAQDEHTLEMPRAISRPLEVLRDRYGLKTSGGCEFPSSDYTE